MNRALLRRAAIRAARLLLNVARPALRQPRLKRLIHAALSLAPGLRQRLLALAASSAPLPPRRSHVPLDSADLSPVVQQHYDALRRRFDARNH